MATGVLEHGPYVGSPAGSASADGNRQCSSDEAECRDTRAGPQVMTGGTDAGSGIVAMTDRLEEETYEENELWARELAVGPG